MSARAYQSMTRSTDLDPRAANVLLLAEILTAKSDWLAAGRELARAVQLAELEGHPLPAESVDQLRNRIARHSPVEERIDELISGKQKLSDEILLGGAESALTEMSNEELISMVSLDLSSAVEV